MSKSKWWKNKLTGDVVIQTGSNRQNMGTVFYRDRSGQTFSETKSKFFRDHTEIKASGFPPLKPKFKPRYATYHLWSEGEAFVKEYEPGKFKVVMKDGSEKEPTWAWRFFAKFFEDGSWTVVSEEEAMALLDKPKAPVPTTGQFGPGPWYGAGLKYVSHSAGFYVYKQKPNTFDEMVGWVSYEVVRHLWDLNMVSREMPRAIESIAGKAATTLDPPAKMLKPKKVLVEWAVSLGAEGPYLYELYPDWKTLTLPGSFKTGRTVEVPQ